MICDLLFRIEAACVPSRLVKLRRTCSIGGDIPGPNCVRMAQEHSREPKYPDRKVGLPTWHGGR